MNIDQLLKEMKLKDKIALLSGEGPWYTKSIKKYHIPSLKMSDGPHGLRTIQDKANLYDNDEPIPAICYPTASLTACSFDVDLMKEMGEKLAEEALANKVNILLGPGVNIKRNPLCGRNFEYFSEDPYLAGKMAASFIKGVEEKGVATSLKHFACNNQEYHRLTSSSIVDERTMRDIYLKPFEIAVKEGHPSTVMCSYNKINDVYSSDNHWLLTDVLRNDFGFNGLVITDWGAMSNRVEAIKAGCDLMMPGGSNYGEQAIKKALKNKEISIEDIDKCVRRILELVDKKKDILNNNYQYDINSHHDYCMKMAEESMVLLKNEDNILPLFENDKIALIGNMAKNYRFQGEGSSHIKVIKKDNLFDQLRYDYYADGYNLDGSTNDKLIADAISIAKNAEKIVLILGLPDIYEAEGSDRSNLNLPDGNIRLLKELLKFNKNLILVIISGSPVEIPNIDEIKGLIWAGLGGEAGASALTNILNGKVNPSGRLAETWPIAYDDIINGKYSMAPHIDSEYREGIYVGYRYFDKKQIKPLFNFGYGLSYTTFKYSNIRLIDNKILIDITNTGNIYGKESVLLYIYNPKEYIYMPIKELKGFKKVALDAKETKTIEFIIDEYTFNTWDHGYKKLSGDYIIKIGTEELNYHLYADYINQDIYKNTWYETLEGIPTREDHQLLTNKLYKETRNKKGSFNQSNSLEDMKDSSRMVNFIYKIIMKQVAKHFNMKADLNDPAFRLVFYSVSENSLSNLIICSGLDEALMNAIISFGNGHNLKGIRYLIFKR